MCSCLKLANLRAVLLVPKFLSLEVSVDFHASKTAATLAKLKLMGSINSAHKMVNEDTADNDLLLPHLTAWDDLRARCQEELACLPPKIDRKFYEVKCSSKNEAKDRETIRIMQWNILSQTLAVSNDKFVACPVDALSWWTRRWRLLEEIVSTRPDILCFQEVDHFQFFKRTLSPLGFKGVFLPKPDSPCIYIAGNNGPDGCAIFVDGNKFELLDTKTRTLEVWGYQSHQGAALCKLRRKVDSFEFSVATTHLKAQEVNGICNFIDMIN